MGFTLNDTVSNGLQILISHRPTEEPHGNRRDWRNLRTLIPFLWEYRGRVLIALLALILAKVANVGIPVVLKQIIDVLDVDGNGVDGANAMLLMPIGLLAGYGALRLASSMFNELRDGLFARVRYRAMRRVALRALTHLHALSLRFHLQRQTGGISRDLERGTASISSLLNYMVFQILPIFIEFSLVAGVLLVFYPPYFAAVTFGAVGLYMLFTFKVTNWRMHWRHEMNAMDSKANTQAFDSLINFETVKYFNNEGLEVRRYDESLTKWENAAVKSQESMAAMNFGQGAIIALGVALMMVLATHEVVEGRMSLGDLVMVNTLMLQLFIPLNFLGVVYRSIRYSLADMDRLFVLMERQPDITDVEGAKAVEVNAGEIRFENVSFRYVKERAILRDVTFTVPSGKKVALVGPSGSGKSTLVRLLYRLYDVDAGAIRIDGQTIEQATQDSVRAAIGIVPQDTVLFNDSLYYNLQYANPKASREDIERAAEMAHIHTFIQSLPEGYDTVVGERGLKLSGGEKQRVAIARAILKNPQILVFDEATSSLDSRSEHAILTALREVARHHTTLVIAHRLSTIVDADEILVMDEGAIAERGSHAELLAEQGLYAKMWALQQEQQDEDEV